MSVHSFFRHIKVMSLALCLLCFQGLAQKTLQKVIILHTNDMHAKIDNLAKLAFLKDSLQKSNPLVFLVAAGDNFTGNPVVDMVSDKGFPMIDLMNRCGFDATAFGNHEFDLGQDFLNKRIAQASFPFICCNVDASRAVLKQPPAFMFLNKGDSIRLVLLGIIQRGANGLPDSHPLRLTGLKFTDGIEKAREYTYLKQQYHNLIALTHLGVEEDIKLAESMPQLDLIIGGHSHTLLDTAKFIHGIMIVQAGSQLKWVGKTTITMIDGYILSKQDEIIPMTEIKSERKDVRILIDKYNDNDEMKRVVGRAVKAVKGYDELGALMTDAMRDKVKTDVALHNRGGIRIDSLRAGEITRKDIYQLDPFGNQLVTCNMTLEEIRMLICNAFNASKRPDLEVSGITYRILTDIDGKCMDVMIKNDSGKELSAGNYTVAMNSYIASAYNFNHTGALQDHDITTAEVLIDYLIKVKTVDYSGISRISQSIFK